MRHAFSVVVLAGAWVLAGCGSRAGAAGQGAPATRPVVAPRPASRPAKTASAPASQPTTAMSPAQRAGKVLQLHRQTIELAKAGKFAECRPLLLELLALSPADGIGWYNLGCVHSRLGELNDAIRCLDKSIEFGYADFRHMARDPDLEPLRPLPAFKKLQARNDQVQRARAERIYEQLRKQFGQDYICQIDHQRKLVFATNVDARTLADLKRDLTALAEAAWNDLFTHRFEQYVTVVIPSGADFAKIGFRGGAGYYMHARQMLVARQTGMVLTHEFIHALHSADMTARGQQHPIWVMEGLATLFESSKVAAGHIQPLPNQRLNLLKRLVARGQTLPWEKLFKSSQADFMRQAVIAYPQSRYIMMYLHEKGRLRAWYEAYSAGHEADPTGGRAIEKALGKPLAAAEKDWAAWVRRLKAPPVRIAANQAYLGVRVMGVTDGLEVVNVVPGSGADKAGLRAGDVIVKIDDERISDHGALMQKVSSHEVNDCLRVEYRRNGEYAAAAVVLGPMPAEVAGPDQRPRTTPAAASQPASRPASTKKPPATQPAKVQPARKAA